MINAIFISQKMTRITFPKIALASAALACCALATAQTAGKPNASWSPMREVVFDNKNFTSTGSASDRDTMQALWAAELAQLRENNGGKKQPAFTLVGDVKLNGKHIVFSMFSAAGDTRCIDPGNGSGMSDIYSVCTMRVANLPLDIKKKTELSEYCMIFASDDRKKNKIEYRFDQEKSTLYFRAIQYGKVVPECNRKLVLS